MSDSSELTHPFRELKAPAAARALPKLADRARAEEWGYEKFAHALLSTEVSRERRTAARDGSALRGSPPARRLCA